ncbi:L-threonine transporter%2C anaerobically inducible [Klebsiella pneumoniae]|nr:L-threonine transporter%2C anaerobically inducible [Klebsiella pneumoniae]
MSTTESIASSQTSLSSWRKSDTTWTLGLFGTAIGAGVLFFPIRAGFGGLIPILVMLVLAYPIAFYCHRALARLCLSGANPSGYACRGLTPPAISPKRWKSILAKPAGW